MYDKPIEVTHSSLNGVVRVHGTLLRVACCALIGDTRYTPIRVSHSTLIRNSHHTLNRGIHRPLIRVTHLVLTRAAPRTLI